MSGQDTMNGRLWILSPSYTDVPAFLILQQRIREVIGSSAPPLGNSVHFVLVDDTAGIDRDIDNVACLEDTRVVTPPFNLGHQRAIVDGLRIIADELRSDDLIVTMDADGEDQPEDLPRLIQPFAQPA